MNNWEEIKPKLNQNGIETYDSVPDSIIEYLKKDIKREKKYDMRSKLAGHIQNEYAYTDRPKEVDNFFVNKAFESELMKEHIKSYNMLTRDVPVVLEYLWCNFMKKYEYNPIHTHSGLISFIIFLKIPYKLEDEDKVFPIVNDVNAYRTTSRLQFILPSKMSILDIINIGVDKSFENKMIMFPANYSHLVYPFYTSDKERITVSGNLSFLV